MKKEYTCLSPYDCTYKELQRKPIPNNTDVRNIHARCTKGEYRQFIADIKTLGFVSLQNFMKYVIVEVRKRAEKKENEND